MDAINTFKVENLTVNIHVDQDCPSPRENDNFAHIVAWHHRYDLSDDDQTFANPEEFLEYARKNKLIVLSLYMYDHSSVSLSTQSFVGRAHHADWDSGEVGFVYVSRKEILDNWSKKKFTKQLREQAEKSMAAEVEEYGRYVNGECYGYVIEDENGEEVDSCWGFIGSEYAEQEAKMAAESHIKYIKKNNQEVEEFVDKSMESHTFDTTTIDGLRQAENYKLRLSNKYDKVIVIPVGLSSVRITGTDRKTEKRKPNE